MTKQFLDINGVSFLWERFKNTFAKQTDIPSFTNKTELDKIKPGDVDAWNDMVVSGLPTFPNQTTLDALDTDAQGKLTLNGAAVNEDTKYFAGTNISIGTDNVISAVDTVYDDAAVTGRITTIENNAKNYYTKEQVDSKMSSGVSYAGHVLNYSDLPLDAEVGDMYNIENADAANNVYAGDNVIWNGTSWDVLSGVVDMSNVITTDDVISNAELDAILI